MKDLKVKIRLNSPISSSGGEGQTGVVDKDVVHDNLGLPFIPGRRLKGLLRDAYKDVKEALFHSHVSIDIPEVEELFGKRGDSIGGPLIIGDAHLEESAKIKPWLEWFEKKKTPAFLKDDILRVYTSIRMQTAIDEGSGAAKEDTLRSTRIVDGQRTFLAKVESLPGGALSQKEIIGLALAAASLRYMGSGRTRGLGWVSCSLHLGEENLTKTVIEHLSKGDIDGLPKLLIIGEKIDRAERISTGNTGITHFMRYRVTLNKPAIFPRTGGDPFTVYTHTFIPGSTLKGAFGWVYIRSIGGINSNFKRLFIDGDIWFLNAYIVADGTRTLPIPLSIKKEKKSMGEENSQLFDLAYYACEECHDLPQTVRVPGYGIMKVGKIIPIPVSTRLSHHHARAKDRRLGRAMVDDGAFFLYESIQEGKTFEGILLGSASDLKMISELIEGVSGLRLGKSKSAEYGGNASIEFLEIKAIGDFSEGWDLSGDDKGEYLIVNLLSPLITTNEYGHPAPRFPIEELEGILGITLSSCEVASFSRSEWVGGFQSHIGLPRMQWPAIAAGSTWVFKVDTEVKEEALDKARVQGLGLYKEDGFGRIDIRQSTRDKFFEGTLKDKRYSKPPGSPPKELGNILGHIIMERAKAIALLEATTTKIESAPPSGTLLGRLEMAIMENSPSEAEKIISSFKKPAEKSMRRCVISRKVTRSRERKHLDEHVFAILKEPRDFTCSFIDKVLEKSNSGWGDWDYKDQVKNELLACEDKVEEFCKIYLIEFLSNLRRQLRKGGNRGE